MNINDIKAILFDSGRVLNYPSSGHWFITPNFFNYVDKDIFNNIHKKKIIYAFNKSQEYLKNCNSIITEEEEFEYFYRFYDIFSKELTELNLAYENIVSIAKDLVYNYNKYSFFDDALEVIPKLSKKYKLAVVSDAWPSLENVFVTAGIRDFFSSFIISSKLGVTKPNELMYKSSLDELSIKPEEAVFIDDNINNCDGANKLGISTFLLCRERKSYIYYKITCRRHNVIKSLNDINL